MLIKFHQISNGKLTLIPLHVIRYVVDHEDGGASVYTTLPAANPDKQKSFRTKETAEQIYNSTRSDVRLSDGIFSQL